MADAAVIVTVQGGSVPAPLAPKKRGFSGLTPNVGALALAARALGRALGAMLLS